MLGYTYLRRARLTYLTPNNPFTRTGHLYSGSHIDTELGRLTMYEFQ